MHAAIDITKDHCPMTFVKVKLELAKLSSGDTLDVVMEGLEPVANIPKAAKEQGHAVTEVETLNGHFHITIKKA